jgi:hypothetical protein
MAITNAQMRALQALVAQMPFECLHSYTQTRNAAQKLGLNPDEAEREVTGMGGMCDCEFAINGEYSARTYGQSD